MKLNTHKLLLACLFMSLSTAGFSSAFAQDAHYPTIDEIPTDSAFLSSSKMLTWGENEPKSTKNPKDSAAVATKAVSSRTTRATESQRSSTKVDTDANKELIKEKKEDESVLSFNFLYYIFQKYKLQDIVD